MLDERIKRLKDLAAKMVRSLELARKYSDVSLPPALAAQQETLINSWPEMETQLRAGCAPDTAARERDVFLSAWEQVATATPYVKAVSSLPPEVKKSGTAWLQAVVDSIAQLFNTHRMPVVR